MAAVYRQTGRTSQAQNLLTRILEIAPENAHARYNLALLMRDNVKNNAEAMRLFDEVSHTEKASNELKSLAKSATEELRNL
jgi:tetratricopeptide (TPR) repeat protein